MQKDKEAVITKEGNKDMEMEGAKEETLPPGFRFHPTDEELISYYLVNKISDSDFTGKAIADVDLNKCEPWELPGKAKMGQKEWYFFSLRDRKYPTGVRTNRATNTGYWKTTGKDKEILNSVTSELVGMKKTLVFYKGRAPRGEKTNWVMHEYRIHSKSTFRTNKDEWVVCRVFRKSAGAKKYPTSNHTRSAVNPYSTLEVGPGSSMVAPPPMMQLGSDPASATTPHHHFLYGGRNYLSSAELAEVTRVLRSGAGGVSNTSTINLPMHIPQYNLNFPLSSTPGVVGGGGGGGGGFTISGLNLNLGGGGGGGGGATTTTQPAPINLMRPMNMPPTMLAQVHDFSTASNNNMMMTADQNNVAGGYGAVSNANNNPHGGGNNRYCNNNMGMDHCMDLDTYWPNSY